MLKIDSNMTIKMSRGDDVKFPLFLNKGTKISPIRYVFQGTDPKILGYPTSVKTVNINLSTWRSKITAAGQYDFIYDLANTTWKLNGTAVSLATYGISIVMEFDPITGLDKSLQNNDTISIQHVLGDGCEVYFNIYHLRQTSKEPIFTKTFTSDLDLWRGKRNNEAPNGDMKIELLHNDSLVVTGKTLADIPEGEYVYQIKAKLLDDYASQESGSPEYVMETVTNRLKLFIIDDDYSERNW